MEYQKLSIILMGMKNGTTTLEESDDFYKAIILLLYDPATIHIPWYLPISVKNLCPQKT